jgi:Zn-dependent protease with chaperone function
MRTVRRFSLLLAASFSLALAQGYRTPAQELPLGESPLGNPEMPTTQALTLDLVPAVDAPWDPARQIQPLAAASSRLTIATESPDPDSSETSSESSPESDVPAPARPDPDLPGTDDAEGMPPAVTYPDAAPPEPVSAPEDTAAEDPPTEVEPTPTSMETSETSESLDPEAPDPETLLRRELILEADSLYLAGEVAAAADLYRKAKTGGWREDSELQDIPAAPFTDEALLSPGATVYWRESERGIEAGRESQILVPLALLTAEYPAFIPGHIRYTAQLVAYDRPDDAERGLEQALTLYPAHPDLLQTQVQLMMNREQWIEASIAARQFALLNPDHPDAPQYQTLAVENLERFKAVTNAQIRTNAIANVITGVAGYVLTGGLFGPFTALNSTFALLQGEAAIGEQVAHQVRQQLPLLEDEEVNAYVNRIGQDLAAVAGRDEFEYTFDVILDGELNAFALPGGKIFVNAGAILETDSEAELAGLLAHELSHAVLSHGFQLVTQGNLTASVTQYVPFLPGLVNSILVTGYSRQMERQADIVGTQILAASGYAADGMHGLMLALQERYGDRAVLPWLSTHPIPQERVDYLQAIVERGGYNRYAYEGIAPHEYIQSLTAAALEAYEAEQAADGEAPSDAEIEDAVEDVKDAQQEATPQSDTSGNETITPDALPDESSEVNPNFI